MRKFISFLFALIVLLSVHSLSAQVRLIMEMEVSDEGKKLSGVQIRVLKNGSLVNTVTTDGAGNVDIPIDQNGIYVLEVGGNLGLVKKKIEINTKNIPPEVKGTIPYPAEVELFKKVDGLDLSILDQPIGKLYYDPEYGDFGADRKHTQTIKKALDKLMADYEAQKSSELADEKAKKKAYDAAIKIADKAFSNEEWEKAEAEYKKAEALQPIETYPSFQLAELQTKLIKIRETNKKYDAAISKADAAASAGDLDIAIAQYQKASGLKPDETYPKEKASEYQSKLANQAKVEQNYLAAIEKGDNALGVNDLNSAKTAFEEASSLKPTESYPKNKLAEINDILAKKNAKEEEYNTAIKAADEALAAKKYDLAKEQYQKASTVKPIESYPKEQITKVEELLAASAKLDQNYLAAIEKGDNALAANNFEEAKTAFKEASSLKTNEEYPKNKIKEIDQLVAASAAKEKEYKDKISEADKALASENYDLAKTAYEAAKTLKPTEAYPKDKIKEIDGIIAAKAKEEENYKAAIAKGDQALASEDYEAAKIAYNEASTLKPKEQYPKDKLSEIESVVLKNKEAEEKYNKAIQNGDDALADKAYDKAKGFYNEALGLKSSEQYPKDKIAEIESTLSAEAEKEANYAAAIQKGDAAFGAEKWEEAQTAYKEALGIKEDDYPKGKITEIDGKLASLAEEKAAAEKLEADYQALIKSGDDELSKKEYDKAKLSYEQAIALKKDESYPKDKLKEIEDINAKAAAADKAYNDAIAEADKAFGSEKFEDAKAAYSNALSLKDEQYPKDKLAEIESKLTALAAEKEAAAKLEADYQAAIAEGDKNLTDKKYEDALAAFNNALSLKADEKYSAEKITEIKAEQEKLAKEQAEAERLANLQKEYDALIKKADDDFSAKKLDEARTSYQSALALKNDESYPKTKIDEINSILSDAEEQDKAYQAAIAEADQLLGEEDYEKAKAKYVEASSIKSSEAYPKEQITAIDTKIADLAAEAEEIRLNNEAAEAEKAKVEAEYQALIAEGDQKITAGDLEEAKSKFQEALKIKDEQYPKDKITEIDDRIAQLASEKEKEAAAAEQAKIDAEYQALIAEADQKLASSELEAAKGKFEEALKVKDEQYPKDKIAEIDNQIAQLASDKEKEAAAAEQAKIDAEYQGLIAEADQKLASSELEAAKGKFEEALKVKDEQYPKDKIAEIDDQIAQLADAKEKEAAAAAQAKKEAEFQALIAEADQKLENNELEAAKGKYEDALAVKEDAYPANKIAEIEKRISDLANKEAEGIRLAKLETDYLAAIENGDVAFENNDLEKALDAFKKAQNLKSDESYPANKISEINEILSKRAAAKNEKLAEQERQYQDAIASADASFEAEDYSAATKQYKKALELRPSESYPTNKLSEIEGLLASKAAKEEEIRLQQERDARNEASYQTALVTADKLFSEKKWNEAENEYRLALSLKPSESYPQEQMDKIVALMAKKEAALANAEKRKEELKQKEAEFNALMQSAQTSLEKSSYNMAKRDYKAALLLKPSDSYAQSQLKKVEEILARQKKPEIAEKKEESKPIQIKKGPKATISGNAEDEIERIYKEMWAKKNAEKNEILLKKEALVRKLNEEDAKEEEKRLEEAAKKIEAVSISQREQGEVSDKYYMQNYETIKQKVKVIDEVEGGLDRNSERVRNMNYEDAAKLRKEIMAQDGERGERMVEGKKEMVENEEEEVRLTLQTWNKEQKEKRELNYDEFVKRDKDLTAYQSEIASRRLSEGSEQIDQSQKEWNETKAEYNKNDLERIKEQQEIVSDKEEAHRQFNGSRSDIYSENQAKIEEKKEELKEVKEDWNKAAEEKRQDNSKKEYYEGEDLPRQDPKAAEYNQGVTEEIIENDDNSTTIRRTVVNGTEVDVYEKTLFTYGAVHYFKNGYNITEETWNAESK